MHVTGLVTNQYHLAVELPLPEIRNTTTLAFMFSDPEKSIMDTFNKTREETLKLHFDAAVSELRDKIRAHPFHTNYSVYSGTFSEPIGDEIVNRFNHMGIKTIFHKTGVVSKYLSIDVPLSNELCPVSIPVEIIN